MENPENAQPDEMPSFEDSDTAVPPPSRRSHTDYAPPVLAATPTGLPQKSPILAAFLSFLPGLGNIYNGLYRRAVSFFVVFLVFFAAAANMNEGPMFALVMPCIVFIWFFNVFDAYRQAILINYGYRDDADVTKLSMGGWGLAPGVFLVAVGIYGILDQYLDISWDLIFDQWPWLLILGGGGLIAQHYRERRATADEV